MPTESPAAASSPTLTPFAAPSSVTFKYDDGVTDDQRQTIESGIGLGRLYEGDAGPVIVTAYTNFDNLANEADKYYHRPSTSRASTTFRQAFLSHIWRASSSPGTIWVWVNDMWKSLTVPMRLHTMAHEYFHEIQMHLANKEVTATGPIWLYEGAADYAGFGAVAFANRGYTMAQIDQYKITASRGMLSPLSSMITLGDTEAEDTEYPYQVGYLAIEYLIPNRGSDGLSVLKNFWQAQGKGASWQDAFKQTFGMSVDDFYPRFEQYRQTHYPPFCGAVGAPIAQATPAPFGVRFVRQLSPGDMLQLDQTWSNPPNIPYVFCVDGFSLQSLGDQKGKAFTFPKGYAGWSSCGAGCITVYMRPNDPAGTYRLALTLPDGRHADASFQHSTGVPAATPTQ